MKHQRFGPTNFYRQFITIDPARAISSWEGIYANQSAMELSLVPEVVHGAFIETLKERRSIERLKQGRRADQRSGIASRA